MTITLSLLDVPAATDIFGLNATACLDMAHLRPGFSSLCHALALT
jgi:hypothetical protein